MPSRSPAEQARAHLKALRKRADHLGDRANRSAGFSSYDLAERRALLWAIETIEQLEPLHRQQKATP